MRTAIDQQYMLSAWRGFAQKVCFLSRGSRRLIKAQHFSAGRWRAKRSAVRETDG